jgi:hypothetical protein
MVNYVGPLPAASYDLEGSLFAEAPHSQCSDDNRNKEKNDQDRHFESASRVVRRNVEYLFDEIHVDLRFTS